MDNLASGCCLGIFAWELSLGDFRLGFFVWGLSFGTFRLGIFVWDPSLMNFRLGNRAPEAGGTGLLRLGEPAGRFRGNPRAGAALPYLQDTE